MVKTDKLSSTQSRNLYNSTLNHKYNMPVDIGDSALHFRLKFNNSPLKKYLQNPQSNLKIIKF